MKLAHERRETYENRIRRRVDRTGWNTTPGCPRGHLEWGSCGWECVLWTSSISSIWTISSNSESLVNLVNWYFRL